MFTLSNHIQQTGIHLIGHCLKFRSINECFEISQLMWEDRSRLELVAKGFLGGRKTCCVPWWAEEILLLLDYSLSSFHLSFYQRSWWLSSTTRRFSLRVSPFYPTTVILVSFRDARWIFASTYNSFFFSFSFSFVV